jgi:hypothetical protein
MSGGVVSIAGIKAVLGTIYGMEGEAAAVRDGLHAEGVTVTILLFLTHAKQQLNRKSHQSTDVLPPRPPLIVCHSMLAPGTAMCARSIT